MIKKNWKRIALVAGLIALLVAGYFGYGAIRGRSRSSSAFAGLQTQPAQLGDLEATVSATGKVRPVQTVTLSWETTGTVSEVNASLGQVVKKGDMLATLEQTSLPEEVILAQADLVDAQQALDDLLTSHMAQAEALIALEDAKQALGDLDNYELNLTTVEEAVASAQEAVENAQKEVYITESTAGQADIDAAYVQTLLALNALDQAEKNYQPYENKPVDNLGRARYLAELSAAQEAYDKAVRNYNALTSTADQQAQAVAKTALSKAQAQLDENQRELQRIQDGPTPGEKARLQAQEEDARREWERVKDGPDASDIAAAKAKIAAFQATLDLARITAPFDGTITAVDTLVGDDITASSAALRLDDLTHLLINLEISEIDIAEMKAGLPARLTFDALPDRQYTGEVIQVGRVGSDGDGITYFDVTVEVTDPDELILPGMTASVDIVTMQLRDVLLVPNQSIRVENGKQIVYVMRPQVGMTPVEVKLGASSEAFSQVVDGDLKEGDRIVLNPATSTASPENDPGGFFMLRRATGGGGPGGSGGPEPVERRP